MDRGGRFEFRIEVIAMKFLEHLGKKISFHQHSICLKYVKMKVKIMMMELKMNVRSDDDGAEGERNEEKDLKFYF